MPATPRETSISPNSESELGPRNDLGERSRRESVPSPVENGSSAEKRTDQDHRRTVLEKKRVDAEKEYVRNERNEKHATILLSHLEEEISMLEKLPSINRKTTAGDTFVLLERLMEKRAHILARHPKLQAPDPEKAAQLMERYKREMYSIVPRGDVKVGLPYGAEDALKEFGIRITERGELFSEKANKVLFAVDGGDQLDISSITEERIYLRLHKKEPFSFRAELNNEMITYDPRKYDIEIIIGKEGDLRTFAPERGGRPREATDLPTREQMENVTRFAAVIKKIDAPYRAMLHRYDNVPMETLSKEQVKAVLDAHDRVFQFDKQLREAVRQKGKISNDGTYRHLEEQWEYTDDVSTGDIMQMFRISAEDPEERWAEKRYAQFYERYQRIVFHEKGYDELFWLSDHLDFYNELELNDELRQLILKAKKQGYALMADDYVDRGLVVLQNGKPIMHFNLHFPNAQGEMRKDRSDKALMQEVKKYLQQAIR